MLKRILGQAPFDVSLSERIIVVPGQKSRARLVFTGDSEYDLPLSCNLDVNGFVKVDASSFDVMVPAGGKSESELVFSASPDSMILGGEKVFSLEIIDRIFDTKTEYELSIRCEMGYKCSLSKEEAFEKTDTPLYSRSGVFFGNKGEIISLEIPCENETEIKIAVLSGKIKDVPDGKSIHLNTGVNRLFFEMQQDGSFELCDVTSDETIYLDTINPKYFI